MHADLLLLDETHAIRVTRSGVGHRAEPVVRTGGGWRRATPGDGAGPSLVRRLLEGDTAEGAFRVTRGDPGRGIPASTPEEPIEVDQTNESWVIGGRVVVKWCTEPLAGPHPAPERLRRLAAAGFTETPALWGLVEWRLPDTHWVPVASAVSYVPGAQDGWTWVVAEARRALGLEPGLADDVGGRLGALTGRLHLALADDPPALLTAECARLAADSALDLLEEAVRLTREPDPASHDLLVTHRAMVAAELDRLTEAAGAPVLPVHGDLHVGQVLRDGRGDLVVVDFDGNPTLPAAARSAAGPAALDVAGMLVSLENVGHVVRRYSPEVSEGALVAWTDEVHHRFLEGYLDALGPRRELYDDALVTAYAWQQVCRELVYAARHLPRWGYVPAAALRRRLGPGVL